MKKKDLIKIGKDILLQLIPVAIGVYIGIIASNWNADKNHRQYQKEFLKNIAKELESNRAKISAVYQYHLNVSDKIDSIFQIGDLNVLNGYFFENGGFEMIPDWTGVNLPSIESSVYESGIISNSISGMDFETINKISKIYNHQKEYKEFSNMYMLQMIDTESKITTREMFGKLGFLKGDIINYEKSLLNQIDDVLLYLSEK